MSLQTEDELELASLIADCREEGFSRQETADELDIHFNEVKRLIKKYGIKKPPKDKRPERAPKTNPLPINDGIPLMEQAEEILKDRLKVDWRGYWLDGQPVNSDVVVAAAGLTFPES